MNIHLAAFCSRTLFIYNPRFKSQLDRYLRTIPDLPSQPGYNNSLDGGDGIQWWTLRDGLAAE